MTMTSGHGGPRRILVVCTANVCRSFMAEAVLRDLAHHTGVDLAVASAGTHVEELAVDPDAVAALDAIGIPAHEHGPRQLDRSIIRADGSDLILTMTRAHLRDVVAADRVAWSRAFTLRELVRRASLLSDPAHDWSSWIATLAEGRSARLMMTPDPDDDIDDPYGASLHAHEECLLILRSLLAQFVALAPWRRA